MLFEVGHLTRFTYDHPVLLEPLTVRLRPRCDVFQRLVSFELTVETRTFEANVAPPSLERDKYVSVM